MSLRFYKTPGAERPWRPPVMDEDCRRYRRRTKRSNKWIPPRLAFEEIIRNNTASPCSLNDFMDYLVYVEQDAEPLQFFLWYCGYVQTWTSLSPEERALAPSWDPDRGKKLTSKQRRAKNSSKVSNILEILDEESNHTNTAASGKHSRAESAATNFSRPGATYARGSEKEVEVTVSEPSMASSQPFRSDITTIVNHYINPNAPRRLNLTKDDRNAVLTAAASTTHPSALLPAFEKAEALLRGKLHPNFIRHNISNTNPIATQLLRFLGLILFVLGIGLDIALILSSVSRYYRLLSAPLIFSGLAILVAALDGVSLSLHLTHRRHVRPWEVPDLESGTGADKRHRRAATSESVSGAVDPLRKPTLQTLGPENVFLNEEWVATYESRSLWRRVFERSIVSRNKYLRILQDGVVAGAALWAADVLLKSKTPAHPAVERGYVSAEELPTSNHPLGKEVCVNAGQSIGTITETFNTPCHLRPFPFEYAHDLSLIKLKRPGNQVDLLNKQQPFGVPVIDGWASVSDVLEGKPLFVTSQDTYPQHDVRKALAEGTQYLWDSENLEQSVSLMWKVEDIAGVSQAASRLRTGARHFSGIILCVGCPADKTAKAIAFQNFEIPWPTPPGTADPAQKERNKPKIACGFLLPAFLTRDCTIEYERNDEGSGTELA
ncbi:hypothetical protein CkaCkLH20_04793 [Colletotrichum karsti]|uniref:RGS domain-containing protein n=1 Tax=Colletotrichum karsti TaxID=1095194 RepID=A0A9P6I5H2_9PEZI|nr:uncharacterized protein CkaCkLH20_04793 [Colletotrichum karsti]KAF9877658.1 hypothetical protein CkaCkLH20_04793 [Colletotrichum karsti]